MADKFKYFLAATTVVLLALCKVTLQVALVVLGACVRFILFFTVGALFGMTLTKTVHRHDEYEYGH